MIQVRAINPSAFEVSSEDYRILFSYGIPVAYSDMRGGYFKTSEHHSVTTSKHINTWLRSCGQDPAEVDEYSPSEMWEFKIVRGA